MTSPETSERVFKTLLGMTSPPTANELSKPARLSSGMVREHLYLLMREGRVLPSRDPGVPGPKGNGALRWHIVEPPLPVADPTDQVLCAGCVEQRFHHELRYRRSLTARGLERWNAIWSKWLDSYEPHAGEERLDAPGSAVATCDLCGQAIALEQVGH